ncbi:MAG: hypothetical protein ACM3OB_00260 [Acidobacteriota bacterium]
MPLLCRHQLRHGREACSIACPLTEVGDGFSFVRVEHPRDLPPADESILDVAVLDMNHGWPNMGHDLLVHAIQDAACDVVCAEPRLRVRALSFEVRRRHMLPEPPGGRFALYVGTGGPGHLDPRRNDGSGPGSQGVLEDPAWEPRLFALFDALLAHPEAALVSVCHTFGVLCRWSGVAHESLRGPEKGGKSVGLLENVLSPAAIEHPWFGQFARVLPAGGRLRIADTRLFDLLPSGDFGGATPIGFETQGVGGPPGNAVTMIEFARDPAGVMPRMFAVNHHPEVVDRHRQLKVLHAKIARGNVSEEWVAERLRLLTEAVPREDTDRMLHLTSDFTLLGPLRFHLYRQARRRAERLGWGPVLDEDEVPAATLAAGPGIAPAVAPGFDSATELER